MILLRDDLFFGENICLYVETLLVFNWESCKGICVDLSKTKRSNSKINLTVFAGLCCSMFSMVLGRRSD